jgi:hypothetical protein
MPVLLPSSNPVPTSAFVDTDRHIIVTDTNNHRIARVSDMSGAGWTVLGTNGSGAGQFNFPHFTFVRWALGTNQFGAKLRGERA